MFFENKQELWNPNDEKVNWLIVCNKIKMVYACSINGTETAPPASKWGGGVLEVVVSSSLQPVKSREKVINSWL